MKSLIRALFFLNLMISYIALLFYFSFVGDLMISFLPKLLIVNILGLVFCFFYKRKFLLLLSLVLIILIQSVFFLFNITFPSGLEAELKIVSANLYVENEKRSEAITALLNVEADIIVLYEINNEWAALLQNEFPDHTVKILYPRKDCFGIGIISRVPLDAISIPESGPKYFITFSSNKTSFIGVHPFPPIDKHMFLERNHQMDIIIEEAVKIQEGRLCIFGDLNSVPWAKCSVDFQVLTGMKRMGFPQPSWNTGNPLFSMPLDQLFAAKGDVIHKMGYADLPGSDHRMLIFTIAQ